MLSFVELCTSRTCTQRTVCHQPGHCEQPLSILAPWSANNPPPRYFTRPSAQRCLFSWLALDSNPFTGRIFLRLAEGVQHAHTLVKKSAVDASALPEAAEAALETA